MDPVTIGTVAVGMLAPYMMEVGKGAAKKAGEQGLQKVEDLIVAVRGKFGQTNNQFGQQALERLEAKPTDLGRQELREARSCAGGLSPNRTARKRPRWL